MKSVCINCGTTKPKAHEICGSCFFVPETHEDLIHSIIMCYSAEEPHLNFLSIEELDMRQEEIQKGNKIKVDPQVFSQAEEAFSAVKSLDAPQLIHKFSRISSPVFMVILALMLVGLILGT
ncbi:MAG: hypothetical protein KUG82_20745 [Pseudomonadales bacterium]|nr:hypothetical protein [Pseudomonadales bacterium]